MVQEHWKKEPNQLWNIYHDYDTNFIRLSSVANPGKIESYSKEIEKI